MSEYADTVDRGDHDGIQYTQTSWDIFQEGDKYAELAERNATDDEIQQAYLKWFAIRQQPEV